MITVCRNSAVLHREISGENIGLFKYFFRQERPFVCKTYLLLSLKAVAERLTFSAAGREVCLSVCPAGKCRCLVVSVT